MAYGRRLLEVYLKGDEGYPLQSLRQAYRDELVIPKGIDD